MVMAFDKSLSDDLMYEHVDMVYTEQMNWMIKLIMNGRISMIDIVIDFFNQLKIIEVFSLVNLKTKANKID